MRRILSAVLTLMAVVTAQAQTNYPIRPVRLIVPSPPGGGTDTVARILADHLSAAFGQPFIVDNRPGGGSTIGTNAVAQATPDGYTILVAPSSLTTFHLLRHSLPFHVLRDFTPVMLAVSVPHILVSTPKLPFDSFQSFISYAKANPGMLTYASAGNGSSPHMGMELLKMRMGVDLRHIPYRGMPPAMTDLLAGHVGVMISTASAAKQHVDSGALRALAVTTLSQLPSYPGIPSIAEAGAPGYQVDQWYGVMVPAGTPSEITSKLHAAMVTALRHPASIERLAREGATVVAGLPSEFDAFIRDEMARWQTVAEAARIAKTD
jgi:tripartite-type tricarboxylate transporter receptor subunit TctC